MLKPLHPSSSNIFFAKSRSACLRGFVFLGRHGFTQHTLISFGNVYCKLAGHGWGRKSLQIPCCKMLIHNGGVCAGFVAKPMVMATWILGTGLVGWARQAAAKGKSGIEG